MKWTQLRIIKEFQSEIIFKEQEEQVVLFEGKGEVTSERNVK